VATMGSLKTEVHSPTLRVVVSGPPPLVAMVDEL
jgi:hypothetical protein